MLLRKILTLRKELESCQGILRIYYAWALLIVNEERDASWDGACLPWGLQEAAPSVGNTWVEHKISAQWHTLEVPSAVQMTQKEFIFHDPGGSQAWETTQLWRPRITVHLHVSSPTWWPQMVLQPMLLPSLAIEVFSRHASDLANSLYV